MDEPFIFVDEILFSPDLPTPQKLFHATTVEDFESLEAGRPRIDVGRTTVDFGTGFYTTRSFKQGCDLAAKKNGLCIEFLVLESVWLTLNRRELFGDDWSK